MNEDEDRKRLQEALNRGKFICNEADDAGEGIPDTGCGEVDSYLIDGYSFGDKLLEGVMFEVTIKNGKPIVEVTPESKPYFEQLNQAIWLKKAVKFAERADIVTCGKCKSNDIVLPW